MHNTHHHPPQGAEVIDRGFGRDIVRLTTETIRAHTRTDATAIHNGAALLCSLVKTRPLASQDEETSRMLDEINQLLAEACVPGEIESPGALCVVAGLPVWLEEAGAAGAAASRPPTIWWWLQHARC